MAYNYLQRIAIAGAQSNEPATPPAAAAPQMPTRSWLPLTEAIAPQRTGALFTGTTSHRASTLVDVELPALRPGESVDLRAPPAHVGDEEPTRHAGEPVPDTPVLLPHNTARPPRDERPADAAIPNSPPSSPVAGAGDQTTPPERGSDAGQSAAVARVRGAAERAPTLPAASTLEQSSALPTAAGRVPSEPRSIMELTRVLLPAEQRTIVQAPAALRPAPPSGSRNSVAAAASMPPDQSRATAPHPAELAVGRDTVRSQSVTIDIEASDDGGSTRDAAPTLAPPAPNPPAVPRAGTARVEAPTAPPGTIVTTAPVVPVMPPHRAASAAREHRITIGRVEVEVHNPAPAAEVPAKPSLAVTPPSFLDVRYLNRFAFRL